ncbi:DUF2490 domain-containing protein [Pedobacter mucosus]|uniref:DUF2490 domain-containing protein n=1 Tax=Pedobacter mucosus TaxID=2895286 RepID=UPI001EE4B862|nr:DUF2490 domain-containing protein [Pedobacter mucosus]UKT65841.1 DUF2490 domain-containing protein [Pedobacter mucosus]
MTKLLLTPLLFIIFIGAATAQSTESGGWLFISHTQKLSEEFDFLADVQLRSADQYSYWNTVLLRGAINYNLNDHHSTAIGYAFLGEWEKMEGGKDFEREHRLYEQYIFQTKLKKTELTLRARLEQRFQKDDQIKFSQRIRAFASFQIPIFADSQFEKGIYLKAQDEIFLNIQYKENVNGSILDQHRPYAGIGLRTGKKLDIDLGYMRWFQRELDGDVNKNIMQVMITTSF